MDRFVLEMLRAAVVAPLVTMLCVLGGAVIAWQTLSVSTGPLLAALAAGFLAAVGVGAVRVRTAAISVERTHAAQFRRVVEAAAAVDKLVAWSAEELLRGGEVSLPESPPLFDGADLADEAVAELAELQVQAVAALIRVHDESQSAVLLSMLHHFAKREHVLVGRALEKLDLLQAGTEDPDQLEVLFVLDHLVTRLRRWVESKAVVAGESLRDAREPVSVMQVLRGANQEIMHYARVTVAAGTVGTSLGLPRHVGPDLTHLLAELIENATQFSDHATKVQVRAQQVTTGLAIEIEDRVAIPMRPEARVQWNRLLADPDQVDVSALVRAGRIGLLTAATIAQRHGISVQLAENPTGGTTALVVVPKRLLVSLRPPVDSAVHPAPPARPSAAPPVQAAPMTDGGPAQHTHVPQQSAPSPAPQSAGAPPPLPRREVPDQAATQAPTPARPGPATTRPRYALADQFRGAISTDRAQASSPLARPRASGTVPPTGRP
ncbi:ATP-binding protein [Streptomyces justiciae]|uniref:ATP-binding protein n=1 Tax=Streptomyces justiciae TaxID=2780140 RepID=UPI0021188BFC|nr:ATP-binding protein [Streptomyces justiciae]MCW8379834.1 ATP-binding protein [Streptomyces justiciae]